MAKATCHEKLLAESNQYQKVEGNIYFPPESVNWENFTEGDRQYTCPWKGKARYYDITVEGATSQNTAWNYPEPKEAASYLKGYVAFGNDVRVEE